MLVKEQEKIGDKEYRRDMPNTRRVEAVSLEQDLETRQEQKEQKDQKDQEVVKKAVTEMTSPKHSDRIREQGVNSLIQVSNSTSAHTKFYCLRKYDKRLIVQTYAFLPKLQSHFTEVHSTDVLYQ